MKRIEIEGLDGVLKSLHRVGYRVVGPTLKDGVIAYDEIGGLEDMPRGWTTVVEGGSHRLRKTGDDSLFSFTPGPTSLKRFLFPSRTKLFSAVKTRNGFLYEVPQATNGEEPPKYAFIGVRPCEIKALMVQDGVFGGGEYTDPLFLKLRREIFIVAVNCLHPGATCFCSSMSTGPSVSSGFDLALTEILDGAGHFFAVETGTAKGERMLEEIPSRDTDSSEALTVRRAIESASERIVKSLDMSGVPALLSSNREHPEWDSVAQRCLTCSNCTMVCPTCFCTTVEDRTDLTGSKAERWRQWDSCFSLSFARVAGGNFRSSSKARYRHWLTHKLSSWIDQFGTVGCVGCGRCITWCPVGIDLTEVVDHIRKTQSSEGVGHGDQRPERSS